MLILISVEFLLIPVIFRVNLFMLESDYRFGQHVDAVFWSIYRRILHSGLQVVMECDSYQINNFFRPPDLMKNSLAYLQGRDCYSRPSLSQPKFWHWDLFRLIPEFDDFFFNRKHGGLPTTAFQAFATGLILGFRNIFLSGIDFYSPLKITDNSISNRYGHKLPDYLLPLIAKSHKESGYEVNKHSKNIDLLFLEMLRRLYPEANIFCTSKESPLSDYLNVSTFRQDHFEPKSMKSYKNMKIFHETYKRILYKKLGKIGEVQYINGKLSGWAWNSNEPYSQQTIEILDDNEEIFLQFAPNQYKHELDMSGIGQAMNGFTSIISNQPKLSHKECLTIRFANGNELYGSPIYLSGDAKENSSSNNQSTQLLEQDKIIESIRSSGLFDEEWYEANYPWAKKKSMGLIEHFIYIGARMGYKPNPSFEYKNNISQSATDTSNIEYFLMTIKADSNSNNQDSFKTHENNTYIPGISSKKINNVFLKYPKRRGSGRKGIKSLSYNLDHFWYENDDSYKAKYFLTTKQLLPPNLKNLLIIGHNWNLSTGVSRSISHYMNVMMERDDINITSIELENNATASILENDIKTSDFVIFNSIALFMNHDGFAELIKECDPNRYAIYPHETEWGFDTFQKQQPERYSQFKKLARKSNFFCVSHMQAKLLKNRFSTINTHIIYETTTLSCGFNIKKIRHDIQKESPVRIIMAGTIQPRKGVTLFSETADLAKSSGKNWQFIWAGKPHIEEVYKSNNVEFVGALEGDEYFKFLQECDVFFLSSIDDPFPLSCLEAIHFYKRLIVFKETGISEIVSDLSGAKIYNAHNPEAAFRALETVVASNIDVEMFSILGEKFRVVNFILRINNAISDCINRN